jgi:hypothetical protein
VSVDDHVLDPDRKLVWILERGPIDHAILVEDRHVRERAFLQPPAILDAGL